MAWESTLTSVAAQRYPRVLAFAVLLAGSRAVAEDLVQEAFVSTFTAKARFASVDQAEAYVRRAVATRFLDQARRRTKEADVVRLEAPLLQHAPEPVFAPELREALAALPPRERACVVLRHLEGMSTRETAQALGLSEGSVKRYLSDGLAALAARLGPVEKTVERIPVETRRKEARRDR
ncbi:MAG: sigma-70 family RNA polymerase sigma factor [Actinomycetales bacterium]|nr:sigma-70 family RNA polymerase sigma factor [Actinomycetales bacterium]